MLQIIIKILVPVLLTFSICAQSDSSLSMRLLKLEKEIFTASDDTVKNLFVLEKIRAYLNAGVYSSTAVTECGRVQPRLLDSTTRLNYFYNASLLSHLSGDYPRARNYYSKYIAQQKDTSVSDRLFLILIENNWDTNEVRRQLNAVTINDSMVGSLDCLNSVLTYERRGLRASLLASALIPGLGTAVNGKPLKGITSLVIHAGIAAGTILLLRENLYINAALWGVPAFLRFYPGNLRLTRRTFNEREAKRRSKIAGECETVLQDVLKKYPITFKSF